MGQPIIKMGTKFAYQTSVVAWVDLLGYGAEIAAAKYNPADPNAGQAHDRLRDFHQQVANHSRRLFPSLVMNDGAVFYRDLSYRTRSVTYDFISRSWRFFQHLDRNERERNRPGARLVLAAGFRHRGRRAGADKSRGHLKSIFNRFQSGDISAEQAIHEASRSTARFDVIPHLQSNYAFTKAYLAESSGSAAGFSGPGFFLDEDLLDGDAAGEIGASERIDWCDDKRSMSGRFIRVSSILDHGKGYQPNDTYRNGLDVAERLSGDPEILSKLRLSKIKVKR